MKAAIGLVLAFSLTVFVVPAVANDTFRAFSSLPAVEQTPLAPLSDDQLATVEGAASRLGPAVNLNIAVVNQLNLCVLCKDVVQTNTASIRQRNSRFGR
jgi:hypothetical protein